ncbi:GtrA family protein [Mesorhizobium amorphae]|uniref:GtrA family protein n=1 Tax=Mesorhizobium amorphae TaxID=71433 RepID=UPI001185540D|nr:GtrA family protein [Mesorhizobium amorphae]
MQSSKNQHRFIDEVMLGWLPSGLHRVFRFGLAGAASTLVYFVLVNALVLVAGTSPVTASVISYLGSLFLSYALQSRFAFRVKSDSGSQMARFMLTSLCGLCMSFAIMILVNDVLKAPYIVGALAICVLIPTVNYLIFRIWVFRPDHDLIPAPESRNRSDLSDEL